MRPERAQIEKTCWYCDASGHKSKTTRKLKKDKRETRCSHHFGTVNGVMGEIEKLLLKNVAEEDLLIETVTGKKSIPKIYGDTMFFKTLILNGCRGLGLVSHICDEDNVPSLKPQ